MPHPPRFGPAGWSYPHWNSVVYPRPKPRGFHALEYLAGYLDAVEVNTTFYQCLRPEIARLWLQKVSFNRSFCFTAKLNRLFTHERSLDRGLAGAFREGLHPLLAAGRLGCLLMQFPWSFRFTRENRDHLVAMRRLFCEFPLAAEFRHASWMLDEAVGTLIDYRIGFCNIDQPEHIRSMPATEILTTSIAYVRLHGRTVPAWSEDSGDAPAANHYLYKASELEAWAARIRNLARDAENVFVILNNDGGGKAVVNALQLQALAAGRRSAPRALAARFPQQLGSPDAACPPALALEFAAGSDRAVA